MVKHNLFCRRIPTLFIVYKKTFIDARSVEEKNDPCIYHMNGLCWSKLGPLFSRGPEASVATALACGTRLNGYGMYQNKPHAIFLIAERESVKEIILI